MAKYTYKFDFGSDCISHTSDFEWDIAKAFREGFLSFKRDNGQFLFINMSRVDDVLITKEDDNHG